MSKNNMQNELISIILQIDNFEKAKESILSITNQSYENIEIIILIKNKQLIPFDIEELLKKVSNNRVIEYQEKFILNANILKHCAGNYITVIEEGDTYSLDYFREIFYNNKNNNDILFGDILLNKKDKLYYRNYDLIMNIDLDLQENECKDFILKNGKYFPHLFLLKGKLFKKDLLSKILNSNNLLDFNPFKSIELSIKLWSEAKKIKNVHNIFYIIKYYENEDLEFEEFENTINQIQKEMEFIKNTNLDKNNLKEWENYFSYLINRLMNELKNIEHQKARNLLSKYNLKMSDYLSNLYNYYDLYQTPLDESFYNIENLIKAICSSNTEIVSFDIFDTLIKRTVLEPKDIFSFLDIYFNKLCPNANYIYFSNIRILAESQVRKQNKKKREEEVTLNEIYDYIKNNYNFENEIIDLLKDKEIELELKFCKPRKLCQRLYNLALYKNKKVICISDIYLEEEIMCKILNNLNYTDFYKRYFSSKLKITKHTGSLYEYVKKDLNIENNTMIHIGDNWNTDYLKAQDYGILSFHIQSILEIFNNETAFKDVMFDNQESYKDSYDSMSFLGNKCFLANIANEIYDSPIFKNYDSMYNGNCKILGYYPIASALFGEVLSIIKNAKENNIQKIHFLARDGYLIQSAYNEVIKYFDNAPVSNYLLCSRKILFPISIFDKIDIYSLFYTNQNFNMSPLKYYNIFKDTIDMEKESFIAQCKKFKINPTMPILDNSDIKDKFIEFLNHIYSQEKNDLYHLQAKKYYSKIITEKNMLVDIGYSGRAENIFTKLLGYPVDSYYMHTNNTLAYDRANMNGFNTSSFFDQHPKITGTIREYIYMKLDKSCSSIHFDNNNEATYEFSEFNSSNLEIIVNKTMQENAIKSISNFMKTYEDLVCLMNFKPKDLAEFLERYLYLPQLEDAEIFSIVPFDDDFAKQGEKEINLFEAWLITLSSINGYSKYEKHIKKKKINNEIIKRGIIKRTIIKLLYPFYNKVVNRLDKIVNSSIDTRIKETEKLLKDNIKENKNVNNKIDNYLNKQ